MTIPRDRLESVRTALINAIAACDDLEYRVEEALEYRDTLDNDLLLTLADARTVAEDMANILGCANHLVRDRLYATEGEQ